MWCVGHSVMLSVYRTKLPITLRSNSTVLATYSTLLQLKHFPSKIWDAVSSLSVLFLLSSASNREIKFPNFLFPFYTNSHDVVKCFIFFGRTTRNFDIIISSFISNRNDLILSLVVRNSRVYCLCDQQYSYLSYVELKKCTIRLHFNWSSFLSYIINNFINISNTVLQFIWCTNGFRSMVVTSIFFASFSSFVYISFWSFFSYVFI